VGEKIRYYLGFRFSCKTSHQIVG